MKRILCSGWLPKRQDGPMLRARDCPSGQNFLAQSFGHIINPLMTKLVESSWLDFGLFCFAFLWTSTLYRSIKTQNRT